VLNILRKRLHGEEGFTLVELLVVILIIGILAAIAIPSFLNQKGKGEDAAAKSSAREAATAMETYYTDKGTYAGATVTALKAIEATLPAEGTGPNELQLTVVGSTAYRARVFSKNDGRWFEVEKKADGTVGRNCGPAGKGGCNDGSSW
jgi:type IV pilus assembly protein PilA